MPTGPRGEQRPADVVFCAVMVAKIVPGEIEDELQPAPARSEVRRQAGEKCGNDRADALIPERRAEIVAQCAVARRGSDKAA